MLTSLLALEMMDYMLICIGVCAAIGAVTGLVVAFSTRRKNDGKDPVTPPVKEESVASEEIEAEAATADNIVMSRNVIYSVGIDGQLKAGKYQMTNADDSDGKFNVRYNGLVKEYSNGDVLALTDGDTLSPVSGSVVLNKAED